MTTRSYALWGLAAMTFLTLLISLFYVIGLVGETNRTLESIEQKLEEATGDGFEYEYMGRDGVTHRRRIPVGFGESEAEAFSRYARALELSLSRYPKEEGP